MGNTIKELMENVDEMGSKIKSLTRENDSLKTTV